MKKAKIIFQVLFLIISVLVLYFSIDILSNTESYLEQMKVSQYRKFPRYVFITFLTLSIVMVFYFLIERWESLSLRRKVKALEKENLKLKSQIYDLNEEKEKANTTVLIPQITDIEVEEVKTESEEENTEEDE